MIIITNLYNFKFNERSFKIDFMQEKFENIE